MQEHTTEPLVDIDDRRNVTDLLIERAAIAPEHVAFEVPDADPAAPWHPVTTAAFLAEVRQLAKGLIATGIAPGDAIAIMAPTRYAWAVADLASWFAGGVVVPVYETSSLAQVAAIVRDARVRLAIGGAAQVDVLREAFTQTGTGGLGAWSMDAADGVALLATRGAEVDDEELERRRIHADLDAPATIVYTSGTTGEPKGAILTHRNFVGQVLNIAAAYREVVHPGGNTIIFLPLAHVLARGLQLICLASGMRIAHLSDTTRVVETLGTIRPTFLVAVPRVLEKIQAAAAQKAADARLGRVWAAAVSTAVTAGSAAEDRAPARLSVRARRALFDRLFFRRLRAVMGGRVDYVLSGGAALDPELSLFFGGIGVPVIEGYGLTETTAPLTGNLPRDIRSGTVGRPLPGSTVRISAEGEILARGVGVFAGYRDPADTADAFVDGFFRTGDLGRLDAEGRVVLEGRLKDVIVTSNGKTVVPSAWERAVEASPLVAHAVMIGEGRSYLSALLVLDPAAAGTWADAAGSALERDAAGVLTEVTDTRLRAHLRGIVDSANARVSRSEQVRRFAIVLADLDDTELVTQTLKIKRRAVLARAASSIENLYR
ncbi:long-chain fatty acid--CoA ligase [Microbacterium sp. cx-59]|uniref:AMP-dependent synthetase/ligase n=1 Tax=Microbacterium sp. cx-59 TaxID=2891207 RepID=UPI001E4C3174|nr:AMP-dependent synthetase/ligase [Microbacterium sp. cx-59]MCC4908164.1 AMP-dependent synthetase/ligase [Microbacterium sp. cx-59]